MTGFQPKRSKSIDLDISTILIGEHSIGDIFGWSLVDWKAIEPHRGRKFHFGRQRRLDPSIHDQLKPLFERCDPETGDFGALKPSPIVNANLTKLVGYLCRHFGHHHLPTPKTDNLALERTIEQEQLHQGVVNYILNRIEDDSALHQRAGMIKQIAAAAESQLEKHFADLINIRIEESFLAGNLPDRYRLRSLREQGKTRVDETRARNEKELAGLSVPDLGLDDDGLLQIEMAKILLHRFPYVRNYELMLFAELAMLQQPIAPRFVRERTLATIDGRIEKPSIERFDNAITRLGETLRSAEHRSWNGSLKGKTMTFCGSGPLPMSALLCHLMTGARIILVDHDQEAVERSQRLIANLERLEILEAGALTLLRQDAGMLSFHHPATVLPASAEAPITCDAVMMASLVDPDAKAAIARQFSSDPSTPWLLIMRSAMGLSAKLAYDPIPTETFSRQALAYCGETMPSTHVATYLDRIEAIRKGIACTESLDLLAVAHPDVVNTTEVFAKFDVPDNASWRDVTVGSTIDDWIRQLEGIDAKAR